jgi:two-component system C4-dicarboxylate transport sensor histidine kinase DctB
MDVAVFDRAGTVVTAFPRAAETVGINLSWRDYFLWARDQGRPGEIFVTPFRTLVAGNTRGQKALIVVQGIFDNNGKFKGLCLFTVNFDKLAESYIRSVRIGEQGYAFLIDVPNRSILVHPKGSVDGRSFEEVLLPRWTPLHNLFVGMSEGKAGTASYEFEDPSDPSKVTRKLMGYAPVRIGKHFWMLGVTTPESEVEKLFSSFLRRQELLSITLSITILAGAAIMCAALVAWNSMLSRRVEAHARDLERTRAKLLASEKLAALGQMALGLTHEIRNPLSAVRMNVQIIREECVSEELLRENFDILEEEIQRLNRLLGDVMGFARPQPLRLKQADLSQEITKVEQLVRRLLVEEGIVLQIQNAGDLRAMCDIEQIRQVLLNLILNGIEALRESPCAKQIEVKASSDKDEVVVAVSDNGTGIRPEDRQRIFDPFFTTKAQGGGLGLATVQSIVLRHGGSVSVESADAGGTTLVVHLPIHGPSPLQEDSK